MSDLLIPDIDEAVLAKLREQAASHGRTIEDEARVRLANSVGFDLAAWTADLAAFRQSLGPSKGPSAEQIVRDMRDERTRELERPTRTRK